MSKFIGRLYMNTDSRCYYILSAIEGEDENRVAVMIKQNFNNNVLRIPMSEIKAGQRWRDEGVAGNGKKIRE